MVETGEVDYSGNAIKVRRSDKEAHSLVEDLRREQGADKSFGNLTGILLDSSESKHGGSKKVIDPEELWLKSRF